MANKVDYSGMDEATLSQELANLKREQFNLRFQAATSQLEKPSRVREVRRDIARIKTLQTARGRSEQLAKSSRDAQAK